ncbi:MAG: hypothetical protein LBU57_04735 [Dysgonamonadaceae bacterium]|jgi:hypothetical protein|nr:hypothetical protein [Dysgonamonadaceae bacterium]
MNDLMAICIVGIITLGIYRLFELFVRRKERLSIIDKLGEKISSEEIKGALSLPVFMKMDYSYSSWALRISLLMIGIGLGAIVAFIIQYQVIGDLLLQNTDWEIKRNLRGFQETIYFSCIAVFGGIGLLSAYLIEWKQRNRNHQ